MFLGIKNPVISKAQDASAAIERPGKNDPETSRNAPTNSGAMNMANPENVNSEPQITATISGVMPCIRMGKVSSAGT